MSWVIVEITETLIGRSVEVVGPFSDGQVAEMTRRSRHMGRILDGHVNASVIKSYTRELVS